jgi:hypothetical protein
VKGGQGHVVKSIEVVVGVGEGVVGYAHAIFTHHPPFCRIRRPTSIQRATRHSHILRGYT